MHSNIKSHYKEYYQNTINKHKTGLKLVLGGTGLGKTRGIVDVIKDPDNSKIKFIYIANRIQLLSELSRDIANRKLFRIQKNDTDIIKDIHEYELKKILENEIQKKYAKFLLNKNRLRCNAQEIITIHTTIQNSKVYSSTEDGRDFIRERASVFMNYFKNIISTAYRVKENEIYEKGFERNDYEELANDPFFLKLFPYMDFRRNDEARILLITLQKAFFGFFNGYRNVNIFKLENENNGRLTFDVEGENGGFVIFLDEFDFLEPDLIGLLSKDITIKNPFDFVQYFYDAMKKKKLPYKKFLHSYKNCRKDIEKVVTDIDNISKKYGIKYPRINQFVCSDHRLKGAPIFQTRFSVTSYPIFLNPKPRRNAFTLEINFERANSFALLSTINQSTVEIIRIFKELEYKEPEIYSSLLSHCYSNSNVFKDEIQRVKQHPLRRAKVSTNYDKLHYNGFSLYEIEDMKYKTDEEEVMLSYYALYTTPEKVLHNLTKDNLVFGLSATAKIPRILKSFDVSWLNKVLKEKYIEITQDDERFIRTANNDKQFGSSNNEGRNNRLKILEADESLISEEINDLVNVIVRTDSRNVFGKNEKLKFRKKRVLHLFSTIEWIIGNKKYGPNSESHLLFFNSFTVIKDFFEMIPIGNPIVSVEKRGSVKENLFEYYEMIYKGVGFNLVFYDSEKGNKINNEDLEKQGFFNLFFEKKPVLVITTYPSTGNGVNLQYKVARDSDRKTDFLNIHLLDSTYFVFDSIDEDRKDQNRGFLIKRNIYYLSKLQKAKVISLNQFRRYLHSLRHLESVNDAYWKYDDGILNQISVFIQAIGRIERTWDKINDQTIRLDLEVCSTLQRFCLGPEFAEIYNENENFFSYNIKEVFDAVRKIYKDKYKASRNFIEELQESETKTKKEIFNMLNDHERLRLGMFEGNENKIKEVKNDWRDMRILALTHSFYMYESVSKTDFTLNLLVKKGCIFKSSNYDYVNECFYINSQKQLTPRRFIGKDDFRWSVNSIYNRIRNHDIIRDYFEHKGYEIDFDIHQYFFTPYFFQAILVGAIGEESIRAIFEHEKEKIELEDTAKFPDSIFELADFKIKELPVFIDCKNYGQNSINHYELSEDDPLYNYKMNELTLRDSLRKKYSTIKGLYGEKTKYILINLYSNDYLVKYFNENLIDIGHDFKNASIVLIPSALKKVNEDKYENSDEIVYLLRDIVDLKHNYND